MNPRVQFVAAAGVILTAALVLELVRKRKLREEYSLLWLLAVFCLGAMAFHRPLVDVFSKAVGVAYAPSALFTAAFAVGFLLLLHLTVTISRLIEHNKRLAQEMGLLTNRLDELEKASDDVGSVECLHPGAGEHTHAR